MVGNSKILTVSYGTFSCTLEGFDDPFSTMKAIAEYFRDLAADDRYFGAEPPTPDAEMLHRIAEKSIQRQVAAQIEDNGVTLRQVDAAEEAAPAPAAEAPVAEAPVADETQIADVDEVLAGTDADPTTTAAEALSDEDTDYRPADQDDPAAPLPSTSLNDKLRRLRAAAARSDLTSDFTEDEHAGSFFAGSAPVEFEEEAEAPEVETAEPVEEAEVAEAESVEPVEVEVEAEAEVAEEVDVEIEAEVAEAAEDDGDDIDFDAIAAGIAGEDAVEAEAEPEVLADEEELEDVAEADEEELVIEEAPQPHDDRIGRVFAEAAAVAASFDDDDLGADELAPEELAEDDALILGSEEEAAAEADLDDLAVLDGLDDLAEAEDLSDGLEVEEAETAEDLLAPEFEEIAEIDAAEEIDEPLVLDAEDESEEPEAAEVEEAEVAEENDAPDMAEIEVEEEPKEVHVRPTRVIKVPKPVQAEVEDAPEAETELDEAPEAEVEAESVVAEAEEAEVALPAGSSLSDEDEADLMAELASVAADSEATREERRGRERLEEAGIDGTEDDISRILSTTNTYLEGDDNRRRHESINHLKAAVAASKADVNMRGREMDDEDSEPYKSDLKDVIGGPADTAQKRDEPRPAPLVLVSEQRIDTEAPANDVKADSPIRPRRVSLATIRREMNEETEAEAKVSSEDRAKAEFADYVHSMDATELPDLLEAAAAYRIHVMGQETFTRPAVMRSAAGFLKEDEFNREAALRAFGTLLRNGTIRKVARGRFKLAETSRFTPEERIAGE